MIVGYKDDNIVHKIDYIDELIQELKSEVAIYKVAIEGDRESSNESVSRGSGVMKEKSGSNLEVEGDKSSYGSNSTDRQIFRGSKGSASKQVQFQDVGFEGFLPYGDENIFSDSFMNMDFTRLGATSLVVSESDNDPSLPESHETTESGKHRIGSGKILRTYTNKQGKYKRLDLSTVDIERLVTPDKPDVNDTFSKFPGHSTVLKSSKTLPTFDPQVTYLLADGVTNPMGRKIPVVPQPLHNKHVSHHSILPQAESQVTNSNSQLGSHMAPYMSNPTPSRNMSVATASNSTPNRGAHQFGIRAGNPGGGDSSDNSSSDSDTQD